MKTYILFSLAILLAPGLAAQQRDSTSTQRDTAEAGRLRARIGHLASSEFLTSWHGDFEQSGGGTLLDNGPHACDLIRRFLGEVEASEGMRIARCSARLVVSLCSTATTTPGTACSTGAWPNAPRSSARRRSRPRSRQSARTATA